MAIELLAPAGNTSIARSAILSGADAIYIGGPTFGARQAAGNSMDDIAELTRFAHFYGAKVYLTMNTILYDNELSGAQRQVEQAWNSGVDALIVQDLAYLQMDIPPIELHSSTQMFNMSVERVKLHERLGFARVVLERALTLDEIREIRSETQVELEAFIHGAICVGYSGQCYLSHALCGRGGNRGGCAQSCRSNYDLYRKNGELLAKNQQVLSVGDMNLSDRVGAMIDAGVCSLKIEGRLKDESYVVNNVSYYNDILNDLGVERVAQGRVGRTFTPNPLKSFARPSTHYFFDNKYAKVGAAAKSLGEYMGVVQRVDGKGIVIKNMSVELNNGDGVCWLNEGGEVVGTNVNVVEGDRVTLNGLVPFEGADIYRNFDRTFLPTSKDVYRRVAVDIMVRDGVVVASDGVHSVERGFSEEVSVAKNRDLAIRNIESAMLKSGGSLFEVESVDVMFEDEVPFLPASVLNGLRRELLDELASVRVATYKRRERVGVDTLPILSGELDYRANVSNKSSREFYEAMGVSVEGALELGDSCVGREILRTRFCLRRERGLCPKQNGAERAEPLMLENNGRRIEVRFYCDRCEMCLVYLG